MPEPNPPANEPVDEYPFNEDDEFDRQLENDPRFAVCIAAARERIRQGQGVKLEDIVFDD